MRRRHTASEAVDSTQGDEKQEDRENGQREQYRHLGAGLALLVRRARPLITDAGRQSICQLLDLSHRFTTGIARRFVPVDREGQVGAFLWRL